jgi:hypothetical protein
VDAAELEISALMRGAEVCAASVVAKAKAASDPQMLRRFSEEERNVVVIVILQ